MGHLRTCPLHLKLMPTTSLSHILQNEDTKPHFPLITETIAPKPFRIFDLKLFPVGCDLSCLLMHHY